MVQTYSMRIGETGIIMHQLQENKIWSQAHSILVYQCPFPSMISSWYKPSTKLSTAFVAQYSETPSQLYVWLFLWKPAIACLSGNFHRCKLIAFKETGSHATIEAAEKQQTWVGALHSFKLDRVAIMGLFFSKTSFQIFTDDPQLIAYGKQLHLGLLFFSLGHLHRHHLWNAILQCHRWYHPPDDHSKQWSNCKTSFWTPSLSSGGWNFFPRVWAQPLQSPWTTSFSVF